MLEMRLDNVIYRSGLALTRAQARQFVSHGMFTVNGKLMNVPSHIVSVGDVIALKENKKRKRFLKPPLKCSQNTKCQAGCLLMPQSFLSRLQANLEYWTLRKFTILNSLLSIIPRVN
jgi:ribosomal protein S4